MSPGGTNDRGKEKIVEESNPNKNSAKDVESLRRFRKSSFPPAALLGAFASFVAADPVRLEVRVFSVRNKRGSRGKL